MMITIDSDKLIEALRVAIKEHAAGAQTVREIAERAVNDVMEQEIELAKEQAALGVDTGRLRRSIGRVER